MHILTEVTLIMNAKILSPINANTRAWFVPPTHCPAHISSPAGQALPLQSGEPIVYLDANDRTHLTSQICLSQY